MRGHATGGKYFTDTAKMCTNQTYLCCLDSDLKKRSLNYEKVNNLILKSRVKFKNYKTAPQEVLFFLLCLKMCKRKQQGLDLNPN